MGSNSKGRRSAQKAEYTKEIAYAIVVAIDEHLADANVWQAFLAQLREDAALEQGPLDSTSLDEDDLFVPGVFGFGGTRAGDDGQTSVRGYAKVGGRTTTNLA